MTVAHRALLTLIFGQVLNEKGFALLVAKTAAHLPRQWGSLGGPRVVQSGAQEQSLLHPSSFIPHCVLCPPAQGCDCEQLLPHLGPSSENQTLSPPAQTDTREQPAAHQGPPSSQRTSRPAAPGAVREQRPGHLGPPNPNGTLSPTAQSGTRKQPLGPLNPHPTPSLEAQGGMRGQPLPHLGSFNPNRTLSPAAQSGLKEHQPPHAPSLQRTASAAAQSGAREQREQPQPHLSRINANGTLSPAANGGGKKPPLHLGSPSSLQTPGAWLQPPPHQDLTNPNQTLSRAAQRGAGPPSQHQTPYPAAPAGARTPSLAAQGYTREQPLPRAGPASQHTTLHPAAQVVGEQPIPHLSPPSPNRTLSPAVQSGMREQPRIHARPPSPHSMPNPAAQVSAWEQPAPHLGPPSPNRELSSAVQGAMWEQPPPHSELSSLHRMPNPVTRADAQDQLMPHTGSPSPNRTLRPATHGSTREQPPPHAGPPSPDRTPNPAAQISGPEQQPPHLDPPDLNRTLGRPGPSGAPRKAGQAGAWERPSGPPGPRRTPSPPVQGGSWEQPPLQPGPSSPLRTPSAAAQEKLDALRQERATYWPDGAPRAVASNGTTTTWSFPLRFSNRTVFTRTFTADVPPACKGRRCAVMVDFHPYYSNGAVEREWTRWFAYQRDTGAPFILVTPDGSGDIIPGGATSDEDDSQGWNVLGWGEQATPVNHLAAHCKTHEEATCLDWAVHHYRCYASQRELDPAVCTEPTRHDLRQVVASRLVTRLRNLFKLKSAGPDLTQQEEEDQTGRMTSSSCAAMSAQNDAEFVAKTLRFVVNRLNGDQRRIYFLGQSQGAMAALGFAAPGVLPADLQPAAVVACSAAAARSHTVDLGGRVQTLLMHGSRDDIVPPTVWSGVLKNTSFVMTTGLWLDIVKAAQEEAHTILKRHSNNSVPANLNPSGAVLWANVLTGGQFLRQQQRLLARDMGCPNRWGEATSISLDGFLYDPFTRTLSGVAGREVDMSRLHFQAPLTLPQPARMSIRCASVPNVAAPVTACIFNGGHCLPWQKWVEYDCDWTEASGKGRVFHDFVWRDFLGGGSMTRLE